MVNLTIKYTITRLNTGRGKSRAAIVHLNFRAGSTIPVADCTVPSSMDRTSRCNKVGAVRLYASYRLNLLKEQICVKSYNKTFVKIRLIPSKSFKEEFTRMMYNYKR